MDVGDSAKSIYIAQTWGGKREANDKTMQDDFVKGLREYFSQVRCASVWFMKSNALHQLQRIDFRNPEYNEIKVPAAMATPNGVVADVTVKSSELSRCIA